MKSGFKTDVGKERKVNEDALLILPKYGIFMVADGVGGQSHGDMASRKAVTSAQEFVEQNSLNNFENDDPKYKTNWLMNYFIRCYNKINDDIKSTVKEMPERQGMATTAVTAYVDGQELYVVNIGDSRAYVIRDGILNQITEDHTIVNNLVAAGTLTKSEAKVHPQKNIITKALGVENGVEPDFYKTELIDGDIVMLCSDGLYGEVSDEAMAQIISAGEDMNDTCRELVEAANNNGGNDNITVICIKI